jgi:hypothetical protein
MSASPTADVPRLADVAEHQRLPEHDLLNSLIGRWITVGETIPAEDAPAVKTMRVTSTSGWPAASSSCTPRTGVSETPASVGSR